MKRTVCITAYHDLPVSYLLEEDSLVEIRPLPLDGQGILGRIVAARVEKTVPSISAAFLDIGEKSPLYYSLSENEGRHVFIRHGKKNTVAAGDVILVQIQREPIKSKLALASADFCLTGDTVVVNRTGVLGVSAKITDPDRKKNLQALGEELLSEYKDMGAGLIFRTASAEAEDEIIRKETIKLLCKLNDVITSSRHVVTGNVLYEKEAPFLSDIRGFLGRCPKDTLEIVTDLPAVHKKLSEAYPEPEENMTIRFYEDSHLSLSSLFDLNNRTEQALRKLVNLKSGGTLVIEPTEALTVIDVNSAKAIRGHDLKETFRKINMEAATAAARQIRLRNLSGIILIDFINMKDAAKTAALIEHLKKELAKDPGRAIYHDMTRLGLCEITRKKISPPLHEVFK